jgi:hypothetical protein
MFYLLLRDFLMLDQQGDVVIYGLGVVCLVRASTHSGLLRNTVKAVEHVY